MGDPHRSAIIKKLPILPPVTGAFQSSKRYGKDLTGLPPLEMVPVLSKVPVLPSSSSLLQCDSSQCLASSAQTNRSESSQRCKRQVGHNSFVPHCTGSHVSSVIAFPAVLRTVDSPRAAKLDKVFLLPSLTLANAAETCVQFATSVPSRITNWQPAFEAALHPTRTLTMCTLFGLTTKRSINYEPSNMCIHARTRISTPNKDR